jgi:hypothetical protein
VYVPMTHTRLVTLSLIVLLVEEPLPLGRQ